MSESQLAGVSTYGLLNMLAATESIRPELHTARLERGFGTYASVPIWGVHCYGYARTWRFFFSEAKDANRALVEDKMVILINEAQRIFAGAYVSAGVPPRT